MSFRFIEYWKGQDRSSKAARVLLSSYASIGAQMVHTLAVFPMVLHFYDASTLGVWILIAQVAVYVGILDAGVTGASVRLMVGPLSRGEPDQLQGLFGAAFIFSVIQAVLCSTVSLAAKPVAVLLGLNAEQASLFEPLFSAQMLLSAVLFLVRPFGSVLLAAQRFEASNLATTTGTLLGIGLSYWGLSSGLGLWAVFAGVCLTQSLAVVVGLAYAYRLHLVPVGWWSWGSCASMHLAQLSKESLSFFAAPVFQMASGMLQSLVLARFCGAEGIAIFNAGTKIASLSMMFIQKFQDVLVVGFSELYELGQPSVFERRFRQGLALLFTAWALASLGICSLNSVFLALWTSRRISWPEELNWVICSWLGAVLASRYFANVFTVVLDRAGIRTVPILDFLSLGTCFGLFALLSPSLPHFCLAIAVAPWATLTIFTLRHLRRFLSGFSFFCVMVTLVCGLLLILLLHAIF